MKGLLQSYLQIHVTAGQDCIVDFGVMSATYLLTYLLTWHRFTECFWFISLIDTLGRPTCTVYCMTRQQIKATVHVTRSSAIADKPRDAFRGQSRSPNMVPFHMLGMDSC